MEFYQGQYIIAIDEKEIENYKKNKECWSQKFLYLNPSCIKLHLNRFKFENWLLLVLTKISQKLKETGFILISSNGHRKTGPNGVDGEKPKLPITK